MCAPDHHGETPQSALFRSSSAAPPHFRQCKRLSTHLESDGRKTLSCHAYIYMYTWHEGAYSTATAHTCPIAPRDLDPSPLRARPNSRQDQVHLEEKVSKEPKILAWNGGERALASACEGE